MKYEIKQRNEMGWTNDIAGSEYGNEFETMAEATEGLAFLQHNWPGAEFKIFEIK